LIQKHVFWTYFKNMLLFTTCERKKVLKRLYHFFNSTFSHFSQDICHIWYRNDNSISIRDNLTILTAIGSWDMRLKHRKLLDNMFWNSALLYISKNEMYNIVNNFLTMRDKKNINIKHYNFKIDKGSNAEMFSIIGATFAARR
jgi:hypothetical protein